MDEQANWQVLSDQAGARQGPPRRWSMIKAVLCFLLAGYFAFNVLIALWHDLPRAVLPNLVVAGVLFLTGHLYLLREALTKALAGAPPTATGLRGHRAPR